METSVSELGDLFGLGPLFGQPSKPTTPPCVPGSHLRASNDVCHRCGAKLPPEKKKAQIRKKIVDDVAYIHADDVADLLEANKIQPSLVKTLRALNAATQEELE